MQVGKILFPITTLGPGQRLGLWMLGCTRNCDGCSNPELQVFDASKNIEVDKLIDFILDAQCDGVTISGGEPFLQVKELRKLIEKLNTAGIDDILVYTGFLKETLENRKDPDIDYILSNIAVLIDGPFIKDLVDDVPLRGSSNQRVWLYKEQNQKAYSDCLNDVKRIDIIELKGETHFIGIPFANYKELYPKYIKARKNS